MTTLNEIIERFHNLLLTHSIEFYFEPLGREKLNFYYEVIYKRMKIEKHVFQTFILGSLRGSQK